MEQNESPEELYMQTTLIIKQGELRAAFTVDCSLQHKYDFGDSERPQL